VRGRRSIAALLLVIAAVLLTDAAVIDREHGRRAADLSADSGRSSGPVVRVMRAPARSASPVRLRIARLHVSTTLVRLHKLAGGALEVPARYDRAGWYVGSARPGDAGPAVLAGHVDSNDGPGVFFRLHLLRPGDLVVVDRADLTRITFTVTKVITVPKRAFPTAQVYSGQEPGLRLITCGGAFDAASGHYRDNVIVFARPGGAQ
jgi:hypothetical protein